MRLRLQSRCPGMCREDDDDDDDGGNGNGDGGGGDCAAAIWGEQAPRDHLRLYDMPIVKLNRTDVHIRGPGKYTKRMRAHLSLVGAG